MSSDFKELLAEFNAHGVEFLVVGAHALAAHGHVRATKYLDLWVRPSPGNANKVLEALRSFGAALFDLTQKDLTVPGMVFQIGLPPVRVDIITMVDGVEFDEAWADRLSTRFLDEEVQVLSRVLLIKNKLASGRKQDLADVQWLENHPPK